MSKMWGMIIHIIIDSGSWIPNIPERLSGCCSSLFLYWPPGTGELLHSCPEWQHRDMCVWIGLLNVIVFYFTICIQAHTVMYWAPVTAISKLLIGLSDRVGWYKKCKSCAMKWILSILFVWYRQMHQQY